VATDLYGRETMTAFNSVPAERLAYTPSELAAMVGLSPKAIYRAIHRGELRASRVANGTRLLIPVGAALAWIEASAADSVVPHRPDGTVRHNGSRRPLTAALGSLQAHGAEPRSRE
jgi:excisionase family DNA binding protein